MLTALSTFLPDRDDSHPSLAAGLVKIALGVLLLWLAVKQWRKRPKGDEVPTLPAWMQKVDDLGFGGGLRFGLFLSMVNPKTFILSTSVAIDLGTSDLTGDELIIPLVVFALVAASTVFVPVVAYAIAADRLREPLSALHVWLSRENHTIMCVLFLVLGFSAIGGGIGIIWP